MHERTYLLTFKKKIKAIDDIQARDRAKGIVGSLGSVIFVEDDDIKLQELIPNSPPRKIEI